MKQNMDTIALITLGCAKNLVDSEIMAGRLDQAGYRFTGSMEKSDIIIINTCGFISPARDEADEAFQKALEVKRKKPSVRIIAAGCYVERSRESLIERYPGIDEWMGVGDFEHIVKAAEGHSIPVSRGCYLYDHKAPRFLSTPSSWAYIKISEGCSHRCSFCAIPMIKGTYRSRPIDSIVIEAEKMAQRGIKEINIISQDTTFFGRDLKINNGLALLLERLLTVQGIEWIRILYGYPEEISDSLLNIMTEDKICPYLDIPFQHSHPGIIRSMKRGMDGKEALDLIERIRLRVPECAVRTSLIVGFPGEGKSEFNHLLEFVREARFNHLGVFTYSPEAGTPGFSLGDPVPMPVKEDRRDEILAVQSEISLAHNERREGRILDVLLEGNLSGDPTIYVGRTRFQAPEVDGKVFMERRSHPSGPLLKVEINRADVYDLYGEIIE